MVAKVRKVENLELVEWKMGSDEVHINMKISIKELKRWVSRGVPRW